MLLQFVVENYKSFSNEAILSCVRSPQEKHDPLRLIALYGANAAGKSNLLQALQEARALIVHGTPRDVPISAERPFQLDPTAQARPVRFGFDVLLDGTHYSYGFSVFKGVIFDEFLILVGEDGAEEVIFERDTLNDGSGSGAGAGSDDGSGSGAGSGFGDGSGFGNGSDFGDEPNSERQSIQWHDIFSKFQGGYFTKFIWQGTAPNQLILHKIFDHENQIKSLNNGVDLLLQWFKNSIWIDPRLVHQNFLSDHHITAHEYYSLILNIGMSPGFKDFLEDLLQEADTGVSGIVLKENNSPLKMEKSIILELQKRSADIWISHITSQLSLFRDTQPSQKSIKNSIDYDIVFEHGSTGKQLSWQDESQGTRRLAWLAIMLFNLIHRDDVLFVVDELERSLHPLLSKFILKKLSKSKTAGQLIFTTHDTDLMNIKDLEADSICFVEKDAAGSSKVYSLADFKPEQVSRVREQLELGYFIGRFGAIPILPITSTL